MHTSLSHLSNDELHTRTIDVARREKETTLSLLEHLHEVERRRLFSLRGYGSIWEYTVFALSYL